MTEDPRIGALPDSHGHAKGEHKPFAEERPIPYTARMLFLWFYHACKRGAPRFMMVADHINYLTFEDPAAVHVVRRALKLAQAGDLYGAAETAGVELGHASVVSEGLRKGMRYSIGAEMDNDPRSRPDAQNIVDAMKPDGLIRSVHFLPITHPQHGEGWMWPFDNPEFKEFYEVVGTERVWELYMETLLEAIEKLPGHIVGHFYVPAKFGHWPDEAVLETYEDRFVDACAQRGMAIEINSRYLYKYYAGDEADLERYRSAHLRLMRKAKEKNVMIAVGSDAHSPRDQGNAFEAVLALLDEADINEIAFPLNDRVARVALRATEEILRQHSAALAALAAPPVSARQLGGSLDAPDDEDEEEAAAPPPEAPHAEAAEIILPPGTESKIAAEAAERAEAVRAAEAAQAAQAEAAARPAPTAKAAAKPRKSRAKPKTAPVETAVVEAAAGDGAGADARTPADAEAPGAPGAVSAGWVEPIPAGEIEPIFDGDSASVAGDTVESIPDLVFATELAPGHAPRVSRRAPSRSTVPSRPDASSKAEPAPAVKPAKKSAAPKPGATPSKPAAAAAKTVAPAPKPSGAAPKPATPPPPRTAAAAPQPARKSSAAGAKAGEKKSATAKKAPPKKLAAPAKKGTAKKAAPLKKAVKAAAKKPVAKKSVAKKAAAKKGPAKKAVPARKNVSTAKAAGAARSAKTSKKTAVKKSAKKKSSRR